MDGRTFLIVIVIAMAMVGFIVFLTNNDVWQGAHRANLDNLRTSADDAREGRPAVRPDVVRTPAPAPQVMPQPAVPVVAPKPAPAAPVVVEKPKETPKQPEKPATVQQGVDDFFRGYEAMLEDISTEAEGAKQQELCRAATKQLDERLKDQTWELNCLIQNIKPQPEHLFEISHQAPDEVDLVPDGWTILDKVGSIPLLQLSNKKQFFKGDYIVFVGTPRFDTVTDSAAVGGAEYSNLDAADKATSGKLLPDLKYAYCTLEIAGVPYKQTVHLTDVDVKFVKAADNAARAKWLAQLPKMPGQFGMAPAVPIQVAASAETAKVDLGQFNNFYSSLHPLYTSPEWLTFIGEHHLHHVHEQEADYAKNALAQGVAQAGKTGQANGTQHTPSMTAKTPAKSTLKPNQSKQ